jgi:hypothetical protein|tara:strand:- start:152 stop:517 length:366 start_codon:yes stop_codon:yes gene_type:complete
MAKKVKTNTKSTTHKMVWIIAFIILGVIIIGSIFSLPNKEAEAANTLSGHSTLPGWSVGYRYYYDMDEDKKSKLRLFSKYKHINGNSFKIGWDRQTGKDINQFNTNVDDDGVIFFEQEFKF